MWLAWLSIAVHSVLLCCVLDIYLTNHLVPGFKAEERLENPPARRLILFVCNGLRADKLWPILEDGRGRACDAVNMGMGCHAEATPSVPIIMHPGMLAVTTGMQVNSIVQRVRSFLGGQDAVPSIFDSSGASLYNGGDDEYYTFDENGLTPFLWTSIVTNPEKVIIDPPKSGLQEFKNAFTSSKSNGTLTNLLNKNRTVIYFNLADRDIILSQSEIKTYLQKIDSIVEMMEDYYHDNKTSYVLCSDYGETNIDGRGRIQNRVATPLIAWGSGISKSKNRTKIRQADLAPFIATLVGLPIPANSVGKLHLDMLELSPRQRAEAISVNALQLALLGDSAAKNVPFTWNSKNSNNSYLRDKYLVDIKSNISQGNYSHSINLSTELIEVSIGTFIHYESFYRQAILICHILISSGWFFICLYHLIYKRRIRFFCFQYQTVKTTECPVVEGTEIPTAEPNIGEGNVEEPKEKIAIPEPVKTKIMRNHKLNYVFILIDFPFIASAIFLCYIMINYKLPFHYSVYLLVPLIIWWAVCSNLHGLVEHCRRLTWNLWKYVFSFGMISLILGEFLYWAFVGWIPVGLLLGLIGAVPIYLKVGGRLYSSLWYASLGALGLISCLGEVKENVGLLNIGGGLLIVLTFCGVCLANNACIILTILLAFAQLISLSIQCTGDSIRHSHLSSGPEVDFLVVVSWILTVLGLLYPAVGSITKFRLMASDEERLMQIWASLSIPLLLLSFGFEPIIYLAMCTVSGIWFTFETSPKTRTLTIHDARRSLMFCYLASAAFLCTLNTASPLNFNWTKNFSSSVSEETLSLLIIVKYMCVLFTVTVAFTKITSLSGVALKKLLPLIFLVMNITSVRLFIDLALGACLTVNQDISSPWNNVNPFTSMGIYCCHIVFLILVAISFIVAKHIYRLAPNRINSG